MARSYAARTAGRCTPGERGATVRSTVDAADDDGARPMDDEADAAGTGPAASAAFVAPTGAGAARRPSRRSRAAWRGSSGRRRRGSARGGPATSATAGSTSPVSLPLPVSSSCTRVMPTSSTAAPGLIQSGLHEVRHARRRPRRCRRGAPRRRGRRVRECVSVTVASRPLRVNSSPSGRPTVRPRPIDDDVPCPRSARRSAAASRRCRRACTAAASAARPRCRARAGRGSSGAARRRPCRGR